MTKTERARRRALVAADRARGLSWDAIRERHAIPERTGRRDLEAWRAAHPLGAPQPEVSVAEALAFFEQGIEDLALLAAESHEAVKLGAIKARLRRRGRPGWQPGAGRKRAARASTDPRSRWSRPETTRSSRSGCTRRATPSRRC